MPKIIRKALDAIGDLGSVRDIVTWGSLISGGMFSTVVTLQAALDNLPTSTLMVYGLVTFFILNCVFFIWDTPYSWKNRG